MGRSVDLVRQRGIPNQTRLFAALAGALFPASLATVMAALLAGGLFQAVPARHPLPSMFYGVNLAGAEYADGTYWPSDKIVDYYIGKGFNLVRLPFKWSRMQPALNGALDPANLAEMSRVVNGTTAQGGWIALDMHNYMRRGMDNQGTDIIGVAGSGVTAAHYADGWAKIADVFKDNPRVIFNLMNEPHGIDHTINILN